MKKPALILGALILGVLWVLFDTDYAFTSHIVPGCAQPITVVQYSRPLFGGRGVAFVLGPYTASAIPQQNCVNFNMESGLGASFEAILTCENGTVVVDCLDGWPLETRSTPGIKTRRLDYDAYRELRNWAPNADRRTVINLY